MKITEGMDGIVVLGRSGRWHTLESKDYHGNTLWLLEEDTFGDEWPLMIACDNGDPVVSGFDGWSELDDYIEDGIIRFERDLLDPDGPWNIYKKIGWS